MKKRFIVILIATFVLSLFTSCKEDTSTVKKTKKKQKKQVYVFTKKLERTDIKNYFTVVGKLEGKSDIIMTSETAGKIVAVYKQLGDRVTKGDKIGEIDNEDYKIRLDQAKAQVLSAEASFESAKINKESSEELYKNKNISKIEYSNSLFSFKNAKANLIGAKANLEKSKKNYKNTMFIAPISGYIANIPLKKGEFISNGREICSIVNPQNLIIKTGIGEKYIGNVKKNQIAQIFYNEKKVSVGKVLGFGIKPLAKTGNYPLEISVKNKKKNLYPGMIVEVKILNKVYKNVLSLSLDWIQTEYDKQFVFLYKNEKAVKTAIKTGEKTDKSIIVTSGISENDTIIISGFGMLKDGGKVIAKSMDKGE